MGLGGVQKLPDARGGLSGEDENVRGQWTDLDGKALDGQVRHDAAQDLVARRVVGAVEEDDAHRRGAIWRLKPLRRPRRLREGEGEASPPSGLKLATHEMEGLVGIGGKEKHAPIRVLSRGMWDEFDVLHDVEDISDSDIVGGRGPILDDARDARAHA